MCAGRRSNRAIAAAFMTLGLDQGPSINRRFFGVLAYLEQSR